MKKVNINGKDYPVQFSFRALNELCELKDVTLAELDQLSNPDNVRPLDIVYIAYVGMKEGARRDGRDFKMTIDDIDDMLMTDMSSISKILMAFAGQNSAPEGNSEAPHVGAKQKKANRKK